MKKIGITILCLLSVILLFAQQKPLEKLQFLEGNWNGTGAGFGNETSTIKASYKFIMNNKYIEITHESKFKPTEKNKEGEHHIDKGFISYDKTRNKIIYRQFNNEGYVNQYVLKDSLSTKNLLIFETENIENFVTGGKARITINKISENKIETAFYVSFPNKDYSCFGTNKLSKD